TLLLLPTVPSSFFSYFFCNDPASSQFSTLSLHDALPILVHVVVQRGLQLVQLLAVGLHDRADRLVQVCGTAQHAAGVADALPQRSEEHTSELQSRFDLVCRLLLEKKKTKASKKQINISHT